MRRRCPGCRRRTLRWFGKPAGVISVGGSVLKICEDCAAIMEREHPVEQDEPV